MFSTHVPPEVEIPSKDKGQISCKPASDGGLSRSLVSPFLKPRMNSWTPGNSMENILERFCQCQSIEFVLVSPSKFQVSNSWKTHGFV